MNDIWTGTANWITSLRRFYTRQKGVLVRHQGYADYGRDGTIDVQTYDAVYRDGVRTRLTEQQDGNADSSPDYRRELRYHPNGNQLSEFQEWDRNFDGDFEASRLIRYDESGQLVESIDVVDADARGARSGGGESLARPRGDSSR